MNKYTTIQFFRRKGYFEVIVFYSKNSLRFRESTKVTVLFEHLNDGKKGKQISKSHPSYQADLDRIKKVQDRVEAIIDSYLQTHDDKPHVDWVRKEYDNQVISKSLTAAQNPPAQVSPMQVQNYPLATSENPDNLFLFWLDFTTEKKKTLRSERSLEPYNATKQCLQKFQAKKNQRLAFDILDQDFFNDLFYYLVKEHQWVRRPNDNSLPEVGMQNETAIKRVKNFKEYLTYCVEEGKVVLNIPRIDKFIRLAKHVHSVKELSKTQNWELTLSHDEIEFTINLSHYEPHFWNSLSRNQKRYLDIAIFMALQGTAPIDTKSINELDIRDGMIIKERSKTGNEFKVELDPISEEILVRNKYHMDFTEQSFNDEIKRLYTTIFELYRPHYEKKFGVPYNMIERQKRKKGEEVVWEIKHRALWMEGMTFRRTFITCVVERANELGIKAAMDKAGHVKISTTLGYVHARQPGTFNRSLFGIEKLPIGGKKAA